MNFGSGTIKAACNYFIGNSGNKHTGPIKRYNPLTFLLFYAISSINKQVLISLTLSEDAYAPQDYSYLMLYLLTLTKIAKCYIFIRLTLIFIDRSKLIFIF